MKTLTAAEVAERHNAKLPPKTHNSDGQLKSYVERSTREWTEYTRWLIPGSQIDEV